MYNELYEQMKPLMESGEVFAFAQVVWRQAPCSGKPGDKAIVRKDGSVIGWIGGGCVKGILIKEGLEAIKDQHYRLVKVYPGGQQPDQQEDEHIKIYNMTCYSGGSMEIYIEPVIPNPHLVIVGKSHIARSLAGIARAANFTVSVFAPGADEGLFPGIRHIYDNYELAGVNITSNTVVIVSTQGENDEEAVRNALGTNSRYVGFVASGKKAEQVKNSLRASGVCGSVLARLRAPAGLPINAKLADEVSVSILAEIIQTLREGDVENVPVAEKKTQPAPKAETILGEKKAAPDVIVNPVCNLPISRGSAKYTVEHEGHLLYFCCDGCKVAFDKDPGAYVGK